MPGGLVDSNVLLDVMTEDPAWFDWSSAALAQVAETELLSRSPFYRGDATATNSYW